MFNVKTQQLLLEIPKNGSRSLVQAACDHQGKKWMKCQGHHTLEYFLAEMQYTMVEAKRRPVPPLQVVCVIRSPVERMLSQLRQAERKKANTSLNDLMKVCWEQSDIVFKPQHKFITLPHRGTWTPEDIDLRVWPMGRISEAMTFLAGKPVVYHKNRDKSASSKIDLDKMLEHELYEDIMDAHFGPDYHLWVRAQRSDEKGLGHGIL